MRKSRYSEEQIVGILKSRRQEFRRRSYAASMVSANRRSTAGRRSMAVWK